jgi:hypothetical protein
MMNRIIAFFSIFLIVAQATAAFGEIKAIRDKGAIRHLGVPYARFVSGSGDGFSKELIKGFANDMGMRYEYVEATWKSMIADLTGKTYQVDDGRVDVTGECPIEGDIIATGMTILPWREALLDFQHQPFHPAYGWLPGPTRPCSQSDRAFNQTVNTCVLFHAITPVSKEYSLVSLILTASSRVGEDLCQCFSRSVFSVKKR